MKAKDFANSKTYHYINVGVAVAGIGSNVYRWRKNKNVPNSLRLAGQLLFVAAVAAELRNKLGAE